MECKMKALMAKYKKATENQKFSNPSQYKCFKSKGNSSKFNEEKPEKQLR